MIDYSVKIPEAYWKRTKHCGTLVDDAYNGKGLCIYLPDGYDPGNAYDIFYFKMGTNNTARQFWTFKGHTSNFENVIDHLIENGEIRPCIIVSIQGNSAGMSDWLPDNAYGLLCYIEGKYTTYAYRDAAKIITSAPHRAIGGWSLGAIECRNVLVNEKRNDFWKAYGWFDLQSGYNPAKMDTISEVPFVGCVAGTADDPKCVTFTKKCAVYFAKDKKYEKNHAQLVPGYSHAIMYQLNYFYNAVKYFFGV